MSKVDGEGYKEDDAGPEDDMTHISAAVEWQNNNRTQGNEDDAEEDSSFQREGLRGEGSRIRTWISQAWEKRFRFGAVETGVACHGVFDVDIRILGFQRQRDWRRGLLSHLRVLNAAWIETGLAFNLTIHNTIYSVFVNFA